MDKLKELLAPDMAAIDAVIRARLHSEVALGAQVPAWYVVALSVLGVGIGLYLQREKRSVCRISSRAGS